MRDHLVYILTVGLFGAMCGAGCHPSSPHVIAPIANEHQKVNKVVRPTDEHLHHAKVNESGVVPILEYHDVVDKEDPKKFARSKTNFRKDLDRLYAEGYRPVSLHEYLANRISVPLGTSPVIFTFDDARESQFRYLPDGTIDPECALGIMQQFQKTHTDFVVRATYYILADRMFGQPALAAKKVRALIAMGCEIGNHTVTHRPLASLTDGGVIQELGDAVARAKSIDPEIEMDTLALPLGSWPHNRALLASGTYKGTPYTNRAVLKVGAEPAVSPASVKFNPMSLPRIQASEQEYGMNFWLDMLKRHPDRRYVSDGDPETVTVPKSAEKRVTAINGATLRTY